MRLAVYTSSRKICKIPKLFAIILQRIKHLFNYHSFRCAYKHMNLHKYLQTSNHTFDDKYVVKLKSLRKVKSISFSSQHFHFYGCVRISVRTNICNILYIYSSQYYFPTFPDKTYLVVRFKYVLRYLKVFTLKLHQRRSKRNITGRCILRPFSLNEEAANKSDD